MITRSMIMAVVASASFLAAGCTSERAEEGKKKASFGVPLQNILAIHLRDDGSGSCCGMGGDEADWKIVTWDASAPGHSQKVVPLNDRNRDETLAAHVGQMPTLNFTLDAVMFSPDGKLLVGRTSMNYELHAISVWETETGQQIMSFTSFEIGTPNLIGFTPDAKGVLYRESGGTELPIHRIDIASSMAAPRGGKKHQGMEVFSSDGNLAAGHGSFDESDPNDYLQLWDTQSAKMLQEIRTADVGFNPKSSYSGSVKEFNGFEKCAFSPDNRFFACAYSTWEGNPKVIQGYRDVGISKSVVAWWKIGNARVCEQYYITEERRAGILAFSVDGKSLAVGRLSKLEGPASILILKVEPAGMKNN